MKETRICFPQWPLPFALLVLILYFATGCTLNNTTAAGWRIEWAVQTRASTSPRSRTCNLIVDDKGQPHIAFGQGPLFYTTRMANGWQTQLVDDQIEDSGDAQIELDRKGGLYIGYSSSHLNNPDWFDNDVRYAHFNGTSWTVKQVVAAGLGDNPTMVLDASGQPAFVYKKKESVTKVIGWQYLTWDGNAWKDESLPFIQSFVLNMSLKLDVNNVPWIAYASEEHWTSIMVAHRDKAGWQSQEITRFLTDDYAGKVSLVLDSQGLPHVAFYDAERYDLMYAHWNGTVWQLETVESAGAVGIGATLALDSSDHPHIAYTDSTNGLLKYAFYADQGWQIETVTSESFLVVTITLALDPWGGAHLAYQNPKYQVRYAYRPPK